VETDLRTYDYLYEEDNGETAPLTVGYPGVEESLAGHGYPPVVSRTT
jgi:hypothetical protein